MKRHDLLSMRLHEESALINVSVWSVGGIVVDGRWETAGCFLIAFLWALVGYRVSCVRRNAQ